MSGSWFAVATASSDLVLGLSASQAQPEPWMPSATALTSDLRPSSEPNALVTASARGPDEGNWASAEVGGVRFSQKSEWLMCPPPLNLIADWRAICFLTSLAAAARSSVAWREEGEEDGVSGGRRGSGAGRGWGLPC